MKHKLDRETGFIETRLEDGELWCQGCETVVVKEDYTYQCSICNRYFCPACSATKDGETLICVDCLEKLCGLPDVIEKVRKGIEEIKVSAARINQDYPSYFAGSILGTCKAMLHRLEGVKK